MHLASGFFLSHALKERGRAIAKIKSLVASSYFHRNIPQLILSKRDIL